MEISEHIGILILIVGLWCLIDFSWMKFTDTKLYQKIDRWRENNWLPVMFFGGGICGIICLIYMFLT